MQARGLKGKPSGCLSRLEDPSSATSPGWSPTFSGSPKPTPVGLQPGAGGAGVTRTAGLSLETAASDPPTSGEHGNCPPGPFGKRRPFAGSDLEEARDFPCRGTVAPPEPTTYRVAAWGQETEARDHRSGARSPQLLGPAGKLRPVALSRPRGEAPAKAEPEAPNQAAALKG